MTQYFGDYAEDETVYIPFNTFDSNDPSASVTITNLADADIMVHKDGGVTQIATDGATVAIDFDSITGNHLITIDTSAHADYSTGSDYLVRIEGTTVDAATINAWVGSFSIENRFMRGTDSANTVVPPTVAEFEARTIVSASYATLAKLLAYVQLLARKDAAIATDNSAEVTELNADEGSGAGAYDNQIDSQEAIRDAIVAASPQTHLAGSSNDTTGTIDSGTYADTATINTTYWQISPAGAAVGGFGLNVDLVFTVGSGLDRVPDAINITGYFDSNPNRDTEVWAYNYILADWDQLSNSVTNMQNNSSNQNYQYTNINENHINTSNGQVRIRFTSTSTTTGDDLYIDYAGVSSVAVEAAGLTADAIQQAVWGRAHTGHDEDTLGYNLSKMFIQNGDIVSATDASTFVIDYDIPIGADIVDMAIMVEDKTNDSYEIRRIISTDNAADEITVDRALGFTPVAGDDWYFLGTVYGAANTTHISGTAQTATDLGADIADVPTVAEFEARTIPAADYLVEGDTLARVTLVDTTTTNTDMRGTDSAALATELAKVPKSDGTATWNATALAALQTQAQDALTATFTFTVAGEVDSNAKSMNDIAITGSGTAGDPWT